MKNSGLKALQPLIGEWDLTLSNAWFLDSMETKVSGHASFERIEDSFVIFRWKVGEQPESVCVIGYSDPARKYELFYYDQRGVSRIFSMIFDGKKWALLRKDVDFYQRFEAQIAPGKIQAKWEASEDEGKTWRKDFDLSFTKINA
jgi:hypothetical protein